MSTKPKHNAIANGAKEVSRLVVGGGTAIAVTVATGGNVLAGAGAGTLAFETFDAIDNAESRHRGVKASHTSLAALGVDAVVDPKSVTTGRVVETGMETVGKGFTSLFFAATGADAMKVVQAAVPAAGAQVTIQAIAKGALDTTLKGGNTWIEASRAAPAKMAESFGTYAVPFLKAAPAQFSKFVGAQLATFGAPTVVLNSGEFLKGHERKTQQDDYQLAALRNDPDAYMKSNYNATHLGGLVKNDDFGAVSGHLMQTKTPEGKTEFYRRVPKDLYDKALAYIHKTDPNAPKPFFPEMVDLGKGPEKIQVEIRPPFRNEPLRDSYVRADVAEGSAGLSQSIRFSGAIGPHDGVQASAAGELTSMYRYQTPTASTFRIGLKTPTQGDGIGIRQQDTRISNRVAVGVTPFDFNRLNMADLDDKSSWMNGTRISAGTARVYLDVGDRNRVRLDTSLADRGSSVQQNLDALTGKVYSRARVTGFAELGYGADFLRYQNNPQPGITSTQGPMGLPTASSTGGTPVSINLNAYRELQLYGPDLRAQTGPNSNGLLTTGKGLKPFPPSFEVDDALQLTTTGLFPSVTGNGGPLKEETTWKARK